MTFLKAIRETPGNTGLTADPSKYCATTSELYRSPVVNLSGSWIFWGHNQIRRCRQDVWRKIWGVTRNRPTRRVQLVIRHDALAASPGACRLIASPSATAEPPASEFAQLLNGFDARYRVNLFPRAASDRSLHLK